MLLDIFSSLDFYCTPSFLNFFNFHWSFSVLLFSLFRLSYFFSSNFSFSFVIFYYSMWLSSLNVIKFSFSFMSLIFMYLFFQNLLGLFPYSFPSTSHFFSSFMISMEMWLLSIFFSFSYNPIKFLSHYTPMGSPLFLTSFLKIVEAVSSLVRPMILSLRLAVNISTGHLLLGLLSGGTLSLGPFYFLPFSILLLLYLFIEYGVCLIQGMVFSLLLANYFEESL